MASPTTKQEFIDYCLRKLGAPVIEINVDPDQVDDRVDEALKYYWDYHFDGTSKEYYVYPLTQTDIDNKYISLPDDIIGVTQVFPIGDSLVNTNSLFDIRYQIILNDLYTLTSTTIVPFFMTMQHLQFLEYILVGRQPIRFNRNMNKVYIDMSWKKVGVGTYVVFECYKRIDPDTYPEIWKDRWLARYATALIKKQWGSNLTKFTGMVLPGGIQFNGMAILSDAESEIQQLENEMITSFSLPVQDMIG
jgi:hypothetical protein